MKILIISYFTPPLETVGVKRISYWYEELLKEGNEVKVLTGTKQDSKLSNIIYLQNTASSLLSLFIKDEGLTWKKKLKEYLQTEDLSSYNTILFTGGPFLHFNIAKIIKRKTKARIIFDFRDPFYKNPRFNSSKFIDLVKLKIQNDFLKHADTIITVNKECAKNIEHKNIKIIPNGYDERVQKSIKVSNNIKSKSLIAIGKIYNDIQPDNFLSAISELKEISFKYAGNFDFNSSRVNNLGKLSYKKTLLEIQTSELCILFTGGKPFESTTKIYDYLGLNKKILIITNGILKSGTLEEITKDYPNVYWSKNNTNDIRKNINIALTDKLTPFDPGLFSRRNQFQKLLNLIS